MRLFPSFSLFIIPSLSCFGPVCGPRSTDSSTSYAETRPDGRLAKDIYIYNDHLFLTDARGHFNRSLLCVLKDKGNKETQVFYVQRGLEKKCFTDFDSYSN